MKELIRENQTELLIGFFMGIVMLFIFGICYMSQKQEMEMAKLGMCASKLEGSTSTYWKPCKQ